MVVQVYLIVAKILIGDYYNIEENMIEIKTLILYNWLNIEPL